MHNGAKSFMKSKAEFQIIYEVKDRKIKHPSDFPRYFLSKKLSVWISWYYQFNKSQEVAVFFFEYEIECDSKRKMAPLWNHNHHPLGKKEKSFLSMFCVCYHTKTSSIMSANLRVGISIRPLAPYTKLFCQVWPNKRYNVAERKKYIKAAYNGASAFLGLYWNFIFLQFGEVVSLFWFWKK